MEIITAGFLLKQIHDGMERRANNLLRPYRLTLVQGHVLMILQSSPGQRRTLKELEQILQLAQPTVAGIVKRMEEKGFVTAEATPGDRRSKTVSLTPSAGALCQELEKSRRAAEEFLLSRLGEEERTQLLTLLRTLAETVSQAE